VTAHPPAAPGPSTGAPGHECPTWVRHLDTGASRGRDALVIPVQDQAAWTELEGGEAIESPIANGVRLSVEALSSVSAWADWTDWAARSDGIGDRHSPRVEEGERPPWSSR